MKLVENVACTVCGCVCDDLRLGVEAGVIVRAEGACYLSEPWFLEQHTVRPPIAQHHGAAIDYERGIAIAAELIRSSRYPVIYGLSRSSTEGQRAAIALGDAVGGVIDTTASLCHAPSVMALQEVGESTCSLGEIKNRADLVIYWGADPLRTHPRHLERYSAVPVGEFIAARSGRTLVVVDAAPSATSEAADIFLQVESARDFEAIWTLRMLLRGLEPPADTPTGIEAGLLRDLLERMKSCRCGVVFFGLGLSTTCQGHRSVEALLALVSELNDHTRFYARRLRMQGDVTGADTVLAWQTGYPFSVSLTHGYPRYNPGEFSAADMLARGEPDLCLLVGSEGTARFPAAAIAHLRTIPVIALDHPTVASHPEPTLRFTTDVYGIHRPGTAYRMDEIPIRLRQVTEGHYPADHEVLDAMRTAVLSSGG